VNDGIRHAKCPESPCIGPRCRAHTGKTARKQNWSRPKANKHEGTRGAFGNQKTGKKS
jgi:hypothetical protein